MTIYTPYGVFQTEEEYEAYLKQHFPEIYGQSNQQPQPVVNSESTLDLDGALHCAASNSKPHPEVSAAEPKQPPDSPEIHKAFVKAETLQYLNEQLSPQAKALIHGIKGNDIQVVNKIESPIEALKAEESLRQKSALFNLAYKLSKWEEGAEKWIHRKIPVPVVNDLIAGCVGLATRPVEGFLAGLGGWEARLKGEKLTDAEKELIGAYGHLGYQAEMENLAGEGIAKAVGAGAKAVGKVVPDTVKTSVGNLASKIDPMLSKVAERVTGKINEPLSKLTKMNKVGELTVITTESGEKKIFADNPALLKLNKIEDTHAKMIRSIFNVDVGEGNINFGVKPESKLTQKIITNEPIQKIEVYQFYKSPLGHKGILKTTMEDAVTRISAMKVSPITKQIRFISERFSVLDDIPIRINELPFSELTDTPLGKDYVNYKGNVKLIRWRMLESPEVPGKELNERLDAISKDLDGIAQLPERISKEESKKIESGGILSEQINPAGAEVSALEVKEVPKTEKAFYNPKVNPEDLFSPLESKLDVGEMLKPIARIAEDAYDRLKPLYGVGFGYLGGIRNPNHIQPAINVDVDQKLKDLTDNVVNVDFDVGLGFKTGLDTVLDTFEKVVTKPSLDVPEKLGEFLDIGVVPKLSIPEQTIPDIGIPELTIPDVPTITTPKPKTDTTLPHTRPPYKVPDINVPELRLPIDLGGLDLVSPNRSESEIEAVKSPVKDIWDILF